jgi:hypothetical protein
MSEASTAPVKFDPKIIKWNDLESMELSDKGKKAIRNFILNQPARPEWIRKHPVYKNDYLPIDKVEFMLTILFGTWRVEIKSVFQIVNSVCVTIRLYYWNSDREDFDWQDGAGACPMQVDSGSKATEQINLKGNAVMLAVPIAETNAVKDAADKIGKAFGRDLNRKDTLNYDSLVKNFENPTITEK